MSTATEPQVNFITKLLGEREVGAEEARIRAALSGGNLDKSSASNVITKLLAAPRKAQAQAAGNPWEAVNEAFKDVETSFYAIPAGYVRAQSLDLYGSDYLFVRVRNYGQRKYVSRVHGAPGHPRYSRIDPRTSLALAEIMRGNHVQFAAQWHEHSGNCGKCNATLTDQVSRDRGLGPDCAKMFGI